MYVCLYIYTKPMNNKYINNVFEQFTLIYIYIYIYIYVLQCLYMCSTSFDACLLLYFPILDFIVIHPPTITCP